MISHASTIHIFRQSPQKTAEEATPKTSGRKLQRGRKSISVISPAVKPSDSDLPPFDPNAFKPGQVVRSIFWRETKYYLNIFCSTRRHRWYRQARMST